MKRLLVLLAVATLPAASGCCCARLCPFCPCNWFSRGPVCAPAYAAPVACAPATYVPSPCAPACAPAYAPAPGPISPLAATMMPQYVAPPMMQGAAPCCQAPIAAPNCCAAAEPNCGCGAAPMYANAYPGYGYGGGYGGCSTCGGGYPAYGYGYAGYGGCSSCGNQCMGACGYSPMMDCGCSSCGGGCSSCGDCGGGCSSCGGSSGCSSCDGGAPAPAATAAPPAKFDPTPAAG